MNKGKLKAPHVILKKTEKSALHESQMRVPGEGERRILEATKFVSSNQLSELDNEQIAFLLYFLVFNGTDKRFEDFYDIGNLFGVIAANLNGR